MNKTTGRYKVSFEEGGCDWCSYTDDINEALRYALDKEISSDHEVIVYDQKEKVRIKPSKE